MLLVLPSHVFNWVARPLLLLASALTLGQPVLIRRARAARLTSAGRRPRGARPPEPRS